MYQEFRCRKCSLYFVHTMNDEVILPIADSCDTASRHAPGRRREQTRKREGGKKKISPDLSLGLSRDERRGSDHLRAADPPSAIRPPSARYPLSATTGVSQNLVTHRISSGRAGRHWTIAPGRRQIRPCRIGRGSPTPPATSLSAHGLPASQLLRQRFTGARGRRIGRRD